jgi:hypothetical protein
MSKCSFWITFTSSQNMTLTFLKVKLGQWGSEEIFGLRWIGKTFGAKIYRMSFDFKFSRASLCAITPVLNQSNQIEYAVK